MPKRKCSREEDDDLDYLERKVRRLERKLRESRPAKRKHRRRSRSRSRRRRRRRSPTRSSTRSYEDTRSRSRSARHADSRPTSPHGSHEPDDLQVTPGSEQPAQATEVVPPPGKDNEPAGGPSIDIAAIEATEDTQELDGTILEILGDDPTANTTFGSEIQKDLAIRLQHCVTNGLSKETKKDFMEKYRTPSNCKLISAPALNAEMKAAVRPSEAVVKRDKAIEIKQRQMAAAITALSQALTHLFSSTEKNTELIKILMDATKILCDCQYMDSVTRRNFILSTLNKDMKDQVQSTKVDSFLFGENLSETIKTAKAITKSGAELKATSATKMQSVAKKPVAGPSKPLNWKTPFPSRRQTEAPRTREPASHKTLPSDSSRQSHRRAPPRSTRR